MKSHRYLWNRLAQRRRLGSLRARLPKVAILMMQKNEESLLEFWFTYHLVLVGRENLFIFDNGSTNETVRGQLRMMESLGVNVIWDHDDPISFRNKGMVLLEKMNQLREQGYQLFFPLDCDEFIALETSRGPSIDPRGIAEEWIRAMEFRVCHISDCYFNHHRKAFVFRKMPHEKVFGTMRGVKKLGEGFHRVGMSMEPSRLTYFHYHHRPYDEFHRMAAEKVESRGHKVGEGQLNIDVSVPTPGRHNALDYLMSQTEYEKMFAEDFYETNPCLDEWFARHMRRIPFGRK